jgi:hypothetical protein
MLQNLSLIQSISREIPSTAVNCSEEGIAKKDFDFICISHFVPNKNVYKK